MLVFGNYMQCMEHFKLVLSNQHGIFTKFGKQYSKYSMVAQPEEMIIFLLQAQLHSLIISVLQDGLKIKGLWKEQNHGSMWLKL